MKLYNQLNAIVSEETSGQILLALEVLLITRKISYNIMIRFMLTTLWWSNNKNTKLEEALQSDMEPGMHTEEKTRNLKFATNSRETHLII